MLKRSNEDADERYEEMTNTYESQMEILKNRVLELEKEKLARNYENDNSSIQKERVSEFEKLNDQLNIQIQQNRLLQIKYDQIQVRSIHNTF